MNPRFQCVLTPWMCGSMAFCRALPPRPRRVSR